MFSFGVRTLRREFGDTNPAIEAMSSGLLVMAAAGTMLAASFDIVKKAMVVWPALIGTVKIAIGVIGGLPAVLTALGVAAVALTGIGVLRWISDQTSGMAALRQEAKDLAADLRVLDAEIDALTRSQDRFNLSLSATSLEMQRLKRAIDLQESGTEALEAQYAAMSAEMVNARIEAAANNLVLQERNVINKEGIALADDLERRERAKQLARTRLGGFIREENIYRAMQREGITTGRPTMESLRAVARDQNAQRMGGTSTPSITINFPNAQFNTEGDIEGALMSGAEKAGRILYNQYGVPGNQR